MPAGAGSPKHTHRYGTRSSRDPAEDAQRVEGAQRPRPRGDARAVEQETNAYQSKRDTEPVADAGGGDSRRDEVVLPSTTDTRQDPPP